MGFRIVRVSADLLATLFTEGGEHPGDGRAFEVTKGLPEDAKLVGAECAFATNELLLKFASESWPADPPGSAVMYADVLHTSWTIPLDEIKAYWREKEAKPVTVLG